MKQYIIGLLLLGCGSLSALQFKVKKSSFTGATLAVHDRKMLALCRAACAIKSSDDGNVSKSSMQAPSGLLPLASGFGKASQVKSLAAPDVNKALLLEMMRYTERVEQFFDKLEGNVVWSKLSDEGKGQVLADGSKLLQAARHNLPRFAIAVNQARLHQPKERKSAQRMYNQLYDYCSSADFKDLILARKKGLEVK